jgi:hypothetical protein
MSSKMRTALQQEYDSDFYSWALHNAELLREGRLSDLDIEHLAEEIEGMGKSEKRELMSWLSVLMAHLLKWKFQALRRSKSWKVTIKNQRMEINDLLEESPSLRSELEGKFIHAYKKAVLIASEQTGIDEEIFPKDVPFTLQECLEDSYFPE